MSDIDTLVRATARLESGPNQQGSGFFIGSDLIATCSHVVGNVGDPVKVRCKEGEIEGTVLEVDADSDVALVVVAPSSDRALLSLNDATAGSRDSTWFAYGYPVSAKGAPVLIEGKVQLVDSQDSRGRVSMQLRSDQAGAGTSLRGFSGSAVLSRGRVIGQLRTTPEERGQGTQFGIGFACPSAAIAALAIRANRLLQAPVRRDPQPPLAPYDATWYIARPREERRAIEDLEARKPVVLVGPEYFGKSSLMYRIIELATNRELQRGRTPRVAVVDFAELATGNSIGLPAFFVTFFEALLNSLNVDGAKKLLADYNGAISGPAAGQLMGQILDRSDSPLYLVLHRAEVLIQWPQLDALAQLLRAWASSTKAAFRRLRILAEFSTASALVVEAMPSFNIAPEPIIVDDLDPGQAAELARLYELPWGESEIGRLFAVIGGHPYLLRRAMYLAASQDFTIDQILDVANAGGVFREFVERNIDQIRTTDSLRQATCDLMCGRRPAQAFIRRLFGAGIMRRGPSVNDLPRPAYPLLDPHLRAMCEA